MTRIHGNKKILVLGDMHELGDETKNDHVELGKAINLLNIDAVFGLGEYIKFTLDAINSKKIFTRHFYSKNELIDELYNYYSDGDIIYVKGSRCMEMEKIIYNEVF